jgi:hypothetical protein
MCLVILRAICSWATGNAFPESDFSGTNTWANSEIPHGVSLIVIAGCVKTLAVRAVFRPGFIDERVHIVTVYAKSHPIVRGGRTGLLIVMRPALALNDDNKPQSINT